MEIVLHVNLQVDVLGDRLSPASKLFYSCLFSHLEANFLELVLDESFYHSVFLPKVCHEVFEKFMCGCARLGGVHHVEQSAICAIFNKKIFPFCLVVHLSAQQSLSEQCSESDAVDPLPESPLFGSFFLIFLLSIEYIVDEGADAIVGMQCFSNLIIFVLDANIIPFGIEFELVGFQQLSECIAVGLLCSLHVLLLFLTQLVHIVLECVLALVLFQQSPSRVRHEIIGNLMHLALRGQRLVFFEHLEEADAVDLCLCSFLLIAYFFQF